VARDIDRELRVLVAEAHQRASAVLGKHTDRLIEIAERLVEKETLEAEESGALAGVVRDRAARESRSSMGLDREASSDDQRGEAEVGVAGASLGASGPRW
jgi:hypothetical protein